MQVLLQPMPLLRRSLPFDGPDFLFELKYDGFRSLAVIEGREELFEHVRHSESVAGWHSCAIACEAGDDEANWANPR
jgi:hypothetical protein